MNNNVQQLLESAFVKDLPFEGNYVALTEDVADANQQQTNDVFTEKWGKYASTDNLDTYYQFQRDWYLKLYGFDNEAALKEHLSSAQIILEAGCGLGYKAAWFAKLAPHALVIGMDFSAAAKQASEIFSDLKNLYFIRGDIADTPFRDGLVNYVSCDQVIMHAGDPEATFAELARITKPSNGEFACYFYAKKALPRELLDDYFGVHCKKVSTDEPWDMSEQLTELGRRSSAIDVTFDASTIPLLDIEGGKIDIQRSIYWNFLKCFRNEELGNDTSLATKFDWYSPSNARRFSEAEFRSIVAESGMKTASFQVEDAAYSVVSCTDEMSAF